MGQLYPDLVVTACQEMDLKLCLTVRGIGEKGSFPGDSAIFQNRLFGARRVGGADTGGVGAAVFYKIVLERAARRGRKPVCQRPVMLPEGAACELRIQRGGAFFRLPEDQEAGDRLI